MAARRRATLDEVEGFIEAARLDLFGAAEPMFELGERFIELARQSGGPIRYGHGLYDGFVAWLTAEVASGWEADKVRRDWVNSLFEPVDRAIMEAGIEKFAYSLDVPAGPSLRCIVSPEYVWCPDGTGRTHVPTVTRRLRRLSEAAERIEAMTGCSPSGATIALFTDLRPWNPHPVMGANGKELRRWEPNEKDEALVYFVSHSERVHGPIPTSDGQGKRAGTVGLRAWWEQTRREWNDRFARLPRWQYASWTGIMRRYHSASKRLQDVRRS
jgi:hypothetical protein